MKIIKSIILFLTLVVGGMGLSYADTTKADAVAFAQQIYTFLESKGMNPQYQNNDKESRAIDFDMNEENLHISTVRLMVRPEGDGFCLNVFCIPLLKEGTRNGVREALNTVMLNAAMVKGYVRNNPNGGFIPVLQIDTFCDSIESFKDHFVFLMLSMENGVKEFQKQFPESAF
ncbi:MAG: hypothetical protein LUD17_11110 [Bacteroidales bacterium]|nr:hypothetical protein [Bacteroidales bacterium]